VCVYLCVSSWCCSVGGAAAAAAAAAVTALVHSCAELRLAAASVKALQL
jgi:hypothetical protein